jgi:purine-binding chemotaxis protein CheW
MISTSVESEASQYLTFAVADEEYAVPILRVREILAYEPLTRVPRAPQFISGVMNLRGTVIPVVDLRIKLGLEPTALTPRTCIIVIDVDGESGRTTMGLLSDEVNRVMDLAPDEIEPPPSFGTRIDMSFLFGMGNLGAKFALILDIDRVLTTLEVIAANAAVADATSGEETRQTESKATVIGGEATTGAERGKRKRRNKS